VHPCCTNVSRIILKTNRYFYHTNKELGLDRIILHSCSKRKNSEVSPFYTHSQFIDCQRKWCIPSIKVFFFQLATGGIERAVYKKLIEPFKDDLPPVDFEGLRRVCVKHKYAYFGTNLLKTKFILPLPCQVVPLSENNYTEQLAFILSKNSPYKGLIRWRWVN